MHLLFRLLNLVLDVVVPLVDVGHLLETLKFFFVWLLSVVTVQHVQAAWLIQVHRLDLLVEDVSLNVLAHVLDDGPLTLHCCLLLGLCLGSKLVEGASVYEIICC